MNKNPSEPPVTLSIAAVERDTGLSKDTLRVWERRYGFPLPQRDGLGERSYSMDQVERLRIVKRLLDAGHRPLRVVALPLTELRRLADTGTPSTPAAEPPADTGDVQRLVELILRHDMPALRQQLARLLARQGVHAFLTDVVAPLNRAVGDAWMRGRMQIFEEHLYSEVLQSALRQALDGIPPPAGGGDPHVLLTTLPGEPHGLGLLMAEAMFALEGCRCSSLGAQTPVVEIARAARTMDVHIVALGFSGCLGLNQMLGGLVQLRDELPAAVALWAGGSTPGLQRRSPAGVQLLGSLEQISTELQRRALTT